jgi:hypothetical protein
MQLFQNICRQLPLPSFPATCDACSRSVPPGLHAPARPVADATRELLSSLSAADDGRRRLYLAWTGEASPLRFLTPRRASPRHKIFVSGGRAGQAENQKISQRGDVVAAARCARTFSIQKKVALAEQ